MRSENPNTGTVKVIKGFPVPELETTRDLFLYLPPGYEMSDARYPVLYMHDGQNIFDLGLAPYGAWHIDETLDQLHENQQTGGIIVVGIENGKDSRPHEYVPWPDPMGFGGKGERYMEFLVHTLKPYIDTNYRSLPGREHTAVSGSSLGGYISLCAGLKYQDIFGRIGAFSTVLNLGDEGELLLRFIRETGKQHDMRIYLDIGEQELDFPGVVRDNQRLYETLMSAGFSPSELALTIDPEGTHNEAAWRRRFPQAFRWLMG